MGAKIYQVNAFADKPFSGNPAAVCILECDAEESWMQSVASQMNLSETAFVYTEADGFNLRWFTPTIEVDLCGHATLASAHVLWNEGYLNLDKVAKFNTNSGLLTASKKQDMIILDFPAEPQDEAEIPIMFNEAIGADHIYVGKNRFDYLVQVESEEVVRNLEPNFNLIKQISARGIIVTSISSSDEYDFVSRFFAPASGIDEDPVTGSAHCCLGPFWQKRLGKNEFNAYQASKRGGTIYVEVLQNRVLVGGRAHTVFKGEMA
ncbi:MAG: PhzF family phenazine biosynthesis protein [Thermodesulfobacteriota bacterium]